MSRRIDGEFITQVVVGEEGNDDHHFPIDHKFRQRVEGSDKIWERFSILPNIEGQKYSIGDLFDGGQQEQQEEFIFYDVKKLPSKSVKKGQNIFCRIIVKRNKYWITSCGNNNIWINGVKIAKRTRTRLNFGDFLNLGVKVKFGDEHYKSGLWFQERELDPEAFVPDDYSLKLKNEDVDLNMMVLLPKSKMLVDPSMEFTPGHNELVVSKILSYLDLRHLKQARLVSKLWNKEAAKIMRKRYVVQFDLSNYALAKSSMAFFRYVQEMKNTQMTSWTIYLNRDGWIANLSAKLYQDLDWFLPRGHSITKLDLEAELSTPLDFEMNIKILAQLQHTLEVLELTWSFRLFNTIASEKDCQLLSTIRFKKLQTFDLCMIDYGEDVDGPVSDYSTLLEPLVQAIKGVSTIAVCGTPQAQSSILEYIKKSSPFPNLTAYEVFLGFELEYIPENLTSIMELDKPLTKLELYPAGNLTDQDNSHHLEALLLRHSENLQSLGFYVTPHVYPGTINLPVFPNLKELTVGVKVSDHDEEVLGQVCTIKFPNPSKNYADYAKQFPSLQSLTLTPTDVRPCGEWDDLAERKDQIKKWEKYWDLFKVFFPIRQEDDHEGPQQICKSLKYLSIPYDDERHLPRDTEIATIFPNVFNKRLNKARNN